MGIYSCDYEDCERKPYMECFGKNKDDESCWWYFCFWHYIWSRIIGFIKKDKKLGYAKVDTDREAIEYLREDIWSIQEDLMLIKEKLKIQEPKAYEEEKAEDKGFA